MLLWTSPELLKMHPKQWPIYGTKPADVYSYGIILYEILYRDIPYGNLLTNMGAEGLLLVLLIKEQVKELSEM